MASRRVLIGQSAKTLTVFLAVFSISGLLWGWWRPAVTAVVTDTGAAELDPATAGAPFQSFAVFALATGLLGGVLAGWSFWRSPRLRGPVMLLAVTALAFLGAAVFLLFGNWLADTLHGTEVTAGTADSLSPGESVSVISRVSGAAGYLAAPAAAAVVYWACSLFAPDTAFER
ncbi:hypothetical protein [Corynebacterium sp.]|uniref:hypothetical protein n=1 Tax=Corynebacterium sp. TaxID=1720 RepID=UPI0025C153D9|nr:hypothetical protein [Corynebacterium sp.]